MYGKIELIFMGTKIGERHVVRMYVVDEMHGQMFMGEAHSRYSLDEALWSAIRGAIGQVEHWLLDTPWEELQAHQEAWAKIQALREAEERRS
jgi:hypothetical protein